MTVAIKNLDPTLTEAQRRNRIIASLVDEGSGSYLTIAAAAGTYLTITVAAATYLVSSAAVGFYLPITSAAAVYVPLTSAGIGYLRLDGENRPITAAAMMSGQEKLYFQSSNNFIYGYTTSELHLACTSTMGLKSNTFDIGRAASANIVLNFDTAHSDGKLTWYENLDRFEFADDVVVDADLGANTLSVGATVLMSGLPATDPATAGRLWSSANQLYISAG